MVQPSNNIAIGYIGAKDIRIYGVTSIDTNMVNLIHFFCEFLGMGKEVRSKSHQHKMTIHCPKSAVSQ